MGTSRVVHYLSKQKKQTSPIKNFLNISPEHNRLYKAQNLTAKQTSLSFKNKTFVVQSYSRVPSRRKLAITS